MSLTVTCKKCKGKVFGGPCPHKEKAYYVEWCKLIEMDKAETPADKNKLIKSELQRLVKGLLRLSKKSPWIQKLNPHQFQPSLEYGRGWYRLQKEITKLLKGE